jgi:hypothetical protein
MHTEKIGIEIENWKKKIVKFIQLSKKVIEVLKDLSSIAFFQQPCQWFKSCE